MNRRSRRSLPGHQDPALVHEEHQEHPAAHQGPQAMPPGPPLPSRFRLSLRQILIMVEWMENQTNYDSIYNLGKSRGKKAIEGFKNMATYFIEQLENDPSLQTDFNYRLVEGTHLQARYIALETRHRKRTTGNGFLEPSTEGEAQLARRIQEGMRVIICNRNRQITEVTSLVTRPQET